MASVYKVGSTGSGVRELQNLLNNAGYNLSVDGIYGNLTQNAVRDYQKKNGLMVDGIAGSQTLGALRGAGSAGGSNSGGGNTSSSSSSSSSQIGATAGTGAAGGYDAFKDSGYYQTVDWAGLQNILSQYNKSDAELRAQAEALYNPTYQQQLQSLEQQLATNTLAYQNQIAGLQQAYDKQRRQTNEAYNQSQADMLNQLTKRGLGRSSIVGTQGAYLENQRNEALTDIGDAETSAVSGINQQIQLATQQAAESKALLGTSYAQQIESRINELRNSNLSALGSLQLQIAQLQMQGYQAYQSQLLAEREMALAESQASRSGSSGGGSSSSSAGGGVTPAPTGPQQQDADSILDGLLEGLMGGDAISKEPNRTPATGPYNSISGGNKTIVNNIKYQSNGTVSTPN